MNTMQVIQAFKKFKKEVSTQKLSHTIKTFKRILLLKNSLLFLSIALIFLIVGIGGILAGKSDKKVFVPEKKVVTQPTPTGIGTSPTSTAFATQIITPTTTQKSNTLPNPTATITGVTPKPTTSSSTSTTSNSNPTPTTSTQSQSNFKIDSISPSSGSYNEIITIKGSGFGPAGPGYVAWYYDNKAIPYTQYQSWSDTEIKVPVAGAGAGTYQVSVIKPGLIESNKVSFQVGQGQPYPENYNPSNAAPGASLTITGSRFGGSTGTVYFIPMNNGDKISASISSWSDTQISLTIPSSLSTNTDYFIQIVSSGGSQGSYHTYHIGS